jgi:endonuclease/exonuclease/phosphatase family metal-dependent hydrolase
MPTTQRVATLNLENLDDKPRQQPTLDERLAVMRPQLFRLQADILCLQEVNGQEDPGRPRRLLALERLLDGTPYAAYNRVSTLTTDGRQVFDERNLVILSRHQVTASRQYQHDSTLGALAPLYRKVTARPPETEPKPINWERPILYAAARLDAQRILHILNVHLKSRLPSFIEGQQLNMDIWQSASGWAEGFFLSSMKRVGQALEVRLLIDTLFDADPNALIVVCGDFNSEAEEVPLEAIRGDVENTHNNTLSGRVMVLCERSLPESMRFTLLHRGKGAMLDHILASRSLLTYYKTTEVHNELLHDESTAGATEKLFPESDHAPVVAEFRLPDS